MSTPNQSVLNERVLELEKQCRKQRRSQRLHFTLIALLVGIIFSQYFGFGMTTGKVLTSERLVLKDESGQVRMELSAQNDSPQMNLFDQRGIHRASIALTQGDPGLHLYDSEGFRRAVLGLSNWEPSLIYMDRSGLRHSGLVLMEEGSLGVYQAVGKEKTPTKPLLNHQFACGSKRSEKQASNPYSAYFQTISFPSSQPSY